MTMTNIETETITCALCGAIIPADEAIEFDGYLICNDCDGHAYICDYCGELTDDREYGCSETDDYDQVCQDCLDTNYERCDHCGRYFRDHYMTTVRGSWGHDIEVCADCLDEFYERCNDCDEYFQREYMYYDDVDDVYRCSQCNDYHVSGADYIHEYGYKPEPEFFGADEEDGYRELFMGIELEVDNGDDVYNCARDLDGDHREIYLKHDGSLSDDGFEIVSHPCTLAYHKDLWGDIIDTAKEYGFKSHDARTCGLHVHMNRTYFGGDVIEQNYNIGKLILLMNKHWDNMVKFSRRTYDQLEEWADRLVLEAAKNETPITMDEKVKDKNDKRYVAVNLRNLHTIELRLFNGTLRKESFFATLEFCKNLADAAKHWTIEELNKYSFDALVDINPTEYLREYCEYRGIDLESTGIDIIHKCRNRLEGYKWDICRGDLVHISRDSYFAAGFPHEYAQTDGWYRIIYEKSYDVFIKGAMASQFHNYRETHYHPYTSTFRRSDIDMVIKESGLQRLDTLERLLEFI